MRSRITKSFLIMGFLFGFSSCAIAKVPIEHWTTEHGAEVYFVSIRNLPIIDIQLLFSAGSSYDGSRYGLAAITNNLVGQGTTNQNADEIARTFDSVGAQFATDVDRDSATVALRSLSDPTYFLPSINQFITVLQHPSFRPEALTRIKNKSKAILQLLKQRPSTIAEEQFYQAVYGNQPYGHTPLGTDETIDAVSEQDVTNFYKQFYVNKNVKIVLVGNLSKEAAKKLAAQLSSALQVGRPAKTLATSKPTDEKNIYVPFSSKQTSVLVGQLGINRQNPEFFPLVVGNYIFGGMPLGSVLFTEIRDKRGLAYNADSHFSTLRYKGPFMISLQTRSSKTSEALETIQKSLETFLNNGPTEKQLSAAKDNLLGGFAIHLASNENIAAMVGIIAFYHLPLTYLDDYEKNIRSVTTGQIKKAFNKIIHPKEMTVVTVGPETREQKS